MGQMLDRLQGSSSYYFLDEYLGYNHISIGTKDQEKMTLTFLNGTSVFKRMSFVLCNSPSTFQRCMMSIFSNMLEDTIGVFIDEFLFIGDSFDDCLSHLDNTLQRYEFCNLVLNWEKCSFMVKKGIVLGQKIPKKVLWWIEIIYR